MQRVELVTLNAGGKTLSVPQPGQFTSYTGSGKVTQLNYNREGDVDGFLLDNGVFAKTPPPVTASLASTVAVGSQVSISGYSHQTMNGRTVSRCAVDQRSDRRVRAARPTETAEVK
jgi:hypothetical protein